MTGDRDCNKNTSKEGCGSTGGSPVSETGSTQNIKQ